MSPTECDSDTGSIALRRWRTKHSTGWKGARIIHYNIEYLSPTNNQQPITNQHVLDRLVQFAAEAKLDAGTGNDRPDLADSLSDHADLVWLCVCANPAKQIAVDGSLTVCDQSCRKSDFFTDSVWLAKFAFGRARYSDRLGNDPLEHVGHLEIFQMGCSCASALSRLGLARHHPSTINHLVELALNHAKTDLIGGVRKSRNRSRSCIA